MWLTMINKDQTYVASNENLRTNLRGPQIEINTKPTWPTQSSKLIQRKVNQYNIKFKRTELTATLDTKPMNVVVKTFSSSGL